MKKTEKFTRSEAKLVNISSLQDSPFEPDDRLTPAAIRVLQSEILDDGCRQLNPIHAVAWGNGEAYIADGHRRKAAMAGLGESKVLAYIYYPTAPFSKEELLDHLWETLNVSQRTLKAGPMLVAFLKGGPAFSAGVKSAGGTVKRLFDADEIKWLCDNDITPTVVNTARKIAKYVLSEDFGPDTETFQKRVRKAIVWLMTNNSQQTANIYMRKNYDSQALKNAVDADRPTPRVTSEQAIENVKGLKKKLKEESRQFPAALN